MKLKGSDFVCVRMCGFHLDFAARTTAWCQPGAKRWRRRTSRSLCLTAATDELVSCASNWINLSFKLSTGNFEQTFCSNEAVESRSTHGRSSRKTGYRWPVSRFASFQLHVPAWRTNTSSTLEVNCFCRFWARRFCQTRDDASFGFHKGNEWDFTVEFGEIWKFFLSGLKNCLGLTRVLLQLVWSTRTTEATSEWCCSTLATPTFKVIGKNLKYRHLGNFDWGGGRGVVERIYFALLNDLWHVTESRIRRGEGNANCEKRCETWLTAVLHPTTVVLFSVARGDRVAQLVLERIFIPDLVELEVSCTCLFANSEQCLWRGWTERRHCMHKMTVVPRTEFFFPHNVLWGTPVGTELIH